jgi:hypothetical protein
MKEKDYILQHQKEILLYLKSRFPMYHLSNFFFRDVHYGIRMYLEEQGMKIGYTASEDIARSFVEQLEKAGIFTPIDRQSWVVKYPEFKTPPAKPAAQPKQASPAATAGTTGGAPATGIVKPPAVAPNQGGSVVSSTPAQSKE